MTIPAELIGAIVLLLTTIAAYIKAHTEVKAVQSDRELTKIDRDQSINSLTERLLKLEFQTGHNKSDMDLLFTKYDDLSKQLSAVSTELARATTELANTNKRLEEFTRNA